MYYIALLSEQDEAKVRALEEELGVILIAYTENSQEGQLVARVDEYVDDPNLNLL